MTERKGRPEKEFRRAAQSLHHHPDGSAAGSHWHGEWKEAVAALSEFERAPYDDAATYADIRR